MDFKELTAPCGLACFNCNVYKAGTNEQIRKVVSQRAGIDYEDAYCLGCRARKGKAYLTVKNNILPQGTCFLFANDEGYCKIYLCVESKNLHNCSECSDFPCEVLMPIADKAAFLPHNMKVYNLSQIKKYGLEKWATEHAAKDMETYMTKKFGE